MKTTLPTRRNAVAIVAAAAIGTHLTALANGFVWLDHAHLESRLALATGGSDLLTRGFAGTGYYRPIMTLSLSLDAFIGGGAPWIFHATNLACHAAAAVMTMLTAERALGLSRRAAIASGVLFAVHPLSTLVANAIAFRSEALITIALLGLIWAHVRMRPLLAAATIVVGGLTKESAIVLAPLFVLALEIAQRTNRGEDTPTGTPTATPTRTQAHGRRRLFVAEVAAMAVIFALRFAFAPAWRATHESSPLTVGDALGTRLAALAKSTAFVLIPFVDRSICDAFPITHWWQPASLAGLAVLVALVLLVWRQTKTKTKTKTKAKTKTKTKTKTKQADGDNSSSDSSSSSASACAWMLLFSLLPALQIVPIQRWWSPHYLYVPFTFVAMFAGTFADRFVFASGGRSANHPERRSLATAAAAAILVSALGAVSLYDGRRYADDTSLWTPEVAHQPACREGQFYLAEVEREARRWDSAARRYEAALAPRTSILAYVDQPAALQNLGTVRLEQGRFEDARKAFATALEGTTDDHKRRELTHNLAGAELGQGHAEQAAALLEVETARPDAFPQSLSLRATALRQLGRKEEAQRLMDRLDATNRAAP